MRKQKGKGLEPIGGADKRHRCKIFNCDYRRGNFCCRYCWCKDFCDNPCLNTPKRCKEIIVLEAE